MPIETDEALRKITVFSELPRPLLAQLAGLTGIQRVGKGSILFREGERPHYVYGLVEGSVALSSGEKGGETVADFITAGDLILAPPALLQLPYMVTAQASSDLLVAMLPTEKFRHLAETEIALSAALNRLLCGHWRLLLRHLIQAKTHNAEARLKAYLIDLAGRRKGPISLVLPGSKKDLAAHLGITPETLSRSLKRLSVLGVSTNGAEVRIKELMRLAPAPDAASTPSFPSSGNTDEN